MCKVSDQLKLCTCHAVDTKQLKDYWLLYQEGGGRDVTGELMPPVGFIPDVHNYNNAALTRLLNEGNCFDFDIQLEENDRLELHFYVTSELKRNVWSLGSNNPFTHVCLEYQYKNGKWVDAVWNPFHNDLMEKMQGKIVNAFEKNDS